MAYTNSKLVSYTKISPNKNIRRNHPIDTITIHCAVGQLSVETLGAIFAPSSRQASSNYGVGADGRIGLYVEEKDRAWTSSSASNDNRAVTIEVACDPTHPYAVNSKAYASLIKLVTDICKRNGIKKLLWKNDKSLIGHVDKQNMTVHRWFANKACPGQWLMDHMGEIADKVNDNLDGKSKSKEVSKKSDKKQIKIPDKIRKGSIVAITGTYYYGTKIRIPAWVKSQKWFVISISDKRAVLGRSINNKYNINSPVAVKDLKLIK